MHKDLKLIYKHDKPYGIRDRHGFLLFFTNPHHYQGQDERYREEIAENIALADYVLETLKARTP